MNLTDTERPHMFKKGVTNEVLKNYICHLKFLKISCRVKVH